MKPLQLAAALAVLAATAQPALANLELAQKHACTACHAVDRKQVGPAYKDVARKYAGQKDAVALVSDSIRKGGLGKWGQIPMPAQPALSDAEVKALATWVLASGQ